MSYVVLARKWRPQSFGDIVGQGHITRVLVNAIRAGRIAHCYLLTGVRGVGKTTAARILAKALNCEKGPTPDPCNECTNCAEITNGTSMDVYEMDGASNRGIDEVRQIIENVRYQPSKSRFRVYIIDEVHQVTRDAFNALLKTLEEPPPFVKFILATTEADRLPETILSRCQRCDFRRIPLRDIAGRLQEIADKENLQITRGALLLIAREAEGSMRDAQSLLEQVLSYAAPSAPGKEPAAQVDESLLRDILGIAERRILYDLSQAVVEGKPKRCVELLADVTAHGVDLTRLSRELVEHFRNLLVARLALDRDGEKSGSPASNSSVSGLFDLPAEEIEDLERQVSGVSVDTLMDYFRFMGDGDEEVARSPYPQFVVETTLIRLATLPKAVPVTDAIARLEKLERKLSGGGVVAARTGARSAPPDNHETGKGSASNTAVQDDTRQTWRGFVDYVMKEKRFLALHIENAIPIEMPPGPMKIGVGERHQLTYLRDTENLSMLRDLARRFFSGEVTVTVSPLESGSRPDMAETEDSGPSGENGDTDVVQEALQIFGGTVKEVRRRTEP